MDKKYIRSCKLSSGTKYSTFSNVRVANGHLVISHHVPHEVTASSSLFLSTKATYIMCLFEQFPLLSRPISRLQSQHWRRMFVEKDKLKGRETGRVEGGGWIVYKPLHTLSKIPYGSILICIRRISYAFTFNTSAGHIHTDYRTCLLPGQPYTCSQTDALWVRYKSSTTSNIPPFFWRLSITSQRLCRLYHIFLQELGRTLKNDLY